MRTFVVEDFHEVVKTRLLLQKALSGGLGCLFLEREMHALVTAVLLQMTRLDPLNANAQPELSDG